MGIQKNGLLGTFYNKTGAVIGRRYRGMNMITGHHRLGTKKFSKAQLEQQVKVAVLTDMLTSFPGEVGLGFKRYSKGKDVFNVAFSYNFGNAFIVSPELDAVVVPKPKHIAGPDEQVSGVKEKSDREEVAGCISLNFPKLVLTRGDIYSPSCPSLTITPGDTFICSWLPSPESEFNKAGDTVSMAVWNAVTGSSLHFKDIATRGDLSFSANFWENSSADKLHCYLYCRSADGKQIGDSAYVVLGT